MVTSCFLLWGRATLTLSLEKDPKQNQTQKAYCESLVPSHQETWTVHRFEIFGQWPRCCGCWTYHIHTNPLYYFISLLEWCSMVKSIECLHLQGVRNVPCDFHWSTWVPAVYVNTRNPSCFPSNAALEHISFTQNHWIKHEQPLFILTLIPSNEINASAKKSSLFSRFHRKYFWQQDYAQCVWNRQVHGYRSSFQWKMKMLLYRD